MTTKLIKTIGSWILLTAMLAMFAAATWYLGTGVMQVQVESLMVGGCLMFGAVALAWVRLWLTDAFVQMSSPAPIAWASAMTPDVA